MFRPENLWFLVLVTALFSLASTVSAIDAPPEVLGFPAAPGDLLLIQLDYGSVRIHPRSGSTLDARIIKSAGTAERFSNIEVVSRKLGTRIFLHTYFYSYTSESAFIEVWSPPQVNLVVWGANPNVEISGAEGYVRVHTLTGAIRTQDLISATSLMSDTGNIVFRARRQPQGDIRLETGSGNILCELDQDLNFRAWGRAGGSLIWNGEAATARNALERQIGFGGPLCYASSLEGAVEFKLSDDPGPPVSSERAETKPPLPTDPAPARRQEAGGEPRPSPAGEAPPAQPGETAPTVDQAGTYSTGYKLKVNVDWIYLNASVRERNTNRSVPNLSKEDFDVYEDGVRQTVGRFLQTEEPFHLLLLIDVSGSTEEYMDLIKDASIRFTSTIGPDDRIAVATFNSSFQLRQDFTGDHSKAVAAIRRIRSGGGTAFYDALMRALAQHLNRIEGRKAVIVFSDGVDNQLAGNPGDGSRTSFPALYREIQEADALIYTIFLDTEGAGAQSPGRRRTGGVIDILEDIMRGRTRPSIPSRQPRGGSDGIEEARSQMEMIAEQTGARMYTPQRITDLSSAYSEIADDLRVQYTLGYNSTNPAKDGSWRKVKVSIANRPELVVRTRKGYYAGAQTPSGTPKTS